MHPIDMLAKLILSVEDEFKGKDLTLDDVEGHLNDAKEAGCNEHFTIERSDNEILMKLDENVFIQFMRTGPNVWRGRARLDWIDDLKKKYDEGTWGAKKKSSKISDKAIAAVKDSSNFDDFVKRLNGVQDNNELCKDFILHLITDYHKGVEAISICDIVYKAGHEFKVTSPTDSVLLHLKRINHEHWEATSS